MTEGCLSERLVTEKVKKNYEKTKSLTRLEFELLSV
jgi:hypothetical protein